MGSQNVNILGPLGAPKFYDTSTEMVASLQGRKGTFKSEETASNQSVSKILIASSRYMQQQTFF